jgi:hypothetical protein
LKKQAKMHAGFFRRQPQSRAVEMAASEEEEAECVVEVLASRGSKASSAAAAEDHDNAPATIGEVLAVQSALRPVARAVTDSLPPGACALYLVVNAIRSDARRRATRL